MGRPQHAGCETKSRTMGQLFSLLRKRLRTMESLFAVVPQPSAFISHLASDAVVELKLEGDLEHLLDGVSWNDFHDFLSNDEDGPKVVWLADGVVTMDYELGSILGLDLVIRSFGFDYGMVMCDVFVFFQHGVSPIPVCNVLFDLRSTSDATDSQIRSNIPHHGIQQTFTPVALPVSTQALMRLLSSNHVNEISFTLFEFNEEQSRAIATASTIDHLELDSCSLSDQFSSALNLNQSPRELTIRSYYCETVFDKPLFAAGLRVNTSIETLRIQVKAWWQQGPANWDEIIESIESIPHNRGITSLSLAGNVINDDAWHALCRALLSNGTVTTLDLSFSSRSSLFVVPGANIILPERRAMRTRAVTDMLDDNTVIQQIELDINERDEELYQNSVVPRLELNHYRPHVRSVELAPVDEREEAFLNAYVKAEDNLSKVYLLIRENADVVVAMINS